jgi:hypothetical protein
MVWRDANEANPAIEVLEVGIRQAINIPVALCIEILRKTVEQRQSYALTSIIAMNLHRSEHRRFILHAIANATDQRFSGDSQEEQIIRTGATGASIRFVEGIDNLRDFATPPECYFDICEWHNPARPEARIIANDGEESGS